MRVLTCTTGELDQRRIDELRALCDAAWAAKGGTFSAEGWAAAIGGVHVIVEDGARDVAHASVVERTLELDGRRVRAGYVEAVATLPARQREGLGMRVMRKVNRIIDERFELGALCTGVPRFYEPLGWTVWPGRTAVRIGDAPKATPEEDGNVMIRMPRGIFSPAGGLLVCEWRPGEVW